MTKQTKNIFTGLTTGQRVALVLGIPIIKMMMWSISWLSHYIGNPPFIHAIVLLCSFFLAPWVYVAGIGMVIAVFFEVLLKRKW